MDDAEFLDAVRRNAPLESDDEARAVTEATLRTLGERVTDGEADDLARHLPDPFADAVTDAPGEAEPFGREEFEARLRDRAGVDESEVVPCSRAVASALAAAAGNELDAAREQLPSAFDVYFEPGGPTTSEAFLESVRERAGLDSPEAAEEATRATLRTLGERLTEGEARDLALYVPPAFEADLVETGEESATDYSFDEFRQRVSQREGVEKADAGVHARAVGSTLAEAASDREVDAARKQLPDPFGVVFEPPDDGA